MSKLIRVKAAKRDHRVALWDTDKDHPGGEAYIAGDGSEHEVAETPAVLKALASGRIVRIEESAPETGDAEKSSAPADSDVDSGTKNAGPDEEGKSSENEGPQEGDDEGAQTSEQDDQAPAGGQRSKKKKAATTGDDQADETGEQE